MSSVSVSGNAAFCWVSLFACCAAAALVAEGAEEPANVFCDGPPPTATFCDIKAAETEPPDTPTPLIPMMVPPTLPPALTLAEPAESKVPAKF